MTYFVWTIDEDFNRLEMIRELANSKKKLKGKWQIFLKEKCDDDQDWEVYGYRLGRRIPDEEFFFEYAVFDSRNELVYKNHPKKEKRDV